LITVIDIIEEVAKKHLELEVVTGDTVIFGPDSSLDSLGLVSFLADIESRVYEKYGTEIIIASERAMSQKRSPFRTIQSLDEFVQILLNESP
jgi:hypothetical protein